MARPIQPLILTADQRRELRSIVNRPKTSVPDVLPAWYGDSVCGPVLSGRQDLSPDGAPPPAPGVAEILETAASGDATRSDAAPDPGQLWDAQTPQGSSLAEGQKPAATQGAWPRPVRLALHAHQQFLDEPGRAVLPRSDRGRNPRWQLQRCPGTGHRHRGLPGRTGLEPEALRLEGLR